MASRSDLSSTGVNPDIGVLLIESVTITSSASCPTLTSSAIGGRLVLEENASLEMGFGSL